MKNFYMLFVVIASIVALQTNAQENYVNQIIVGSGGDFNNPDDHVNIASFKPGNGTTTDFGGIITSSIQDICVSGKYAFIAAQDSIAKFDIDTYERVGIVAASGVNQVYVHDNNLWASFQFPVTENFVKVYSADDLSLISEIGDVSDESAGILIADNFAYVAVPGGWTSTTGKIAIVALNDYSLVDEIDFGEEGVGISDLFYHNNSVMSVNRTPWGGTTGYISTMSNIGANKQSYILEAVIGKFSGIVDNMLYTVINGGIGSIDLNNFTIADTVIVEAPVLSIAATVMDTINNLFYVTTTDYFSTGEGTIYDMDGEATGTFGAEISPDAIAIDYRISSAINDIDNKLITVYPNPATDFVTITSDHSTYRNITITDISGRIVYSAKTGNSENNKTLDISSINTGIYFITLTGDKSSSTHTIIKK